MKKIRVGVFGHTGRLGRPLAELLSNHPCAEIVFTESRGEGHRGNLSETELVFFALPYGESEKYLARLDDQKVIDLSIDHRAKREWTYGLPELNSKKIRRAKRVANPGCYATSILLGLNPLKRKLQRICVSSTSGISGAGMRISETDNFHIYKEGRSHPQIGEIESALTGGGKITFVPQRIDTADKGIVSTIFAEAKEDSGNLSVCYALAYGRRTFVRVMAQSEVIETRNVIGTNYCDIKILQFGKTVVIISALDNLIKGGAGQAVQNFNLMFGFPETTGLI